MTIEYDLGISGQPVEPEPVDPEAEARRRRRQRRAAALFLVVSLFVLALIVVPASALEAVRPVGDRDPALPDRWFAVPAGTPLVRDWPMAAASMLLQAGDGDWAVVSTGGSRYARLGLTARDSFPALSDDGTLVAWLSTEGADSGRVHVLRLLDGRSITAPVGVSGFDPLGLRWDQSSVEVSARADVAPTAEDPDPAGAQEVTCFLAPVVSRPDKVISLGVLGDLSCDGTPKQAVALPAQSIDTEPYSTVFDAESGSNASMRIDQGVPTLWVLRVGRTTLPTVRTHPITNAAPGLTVRSARLLAWTAAGLVVEVASTDARLRTSGELRLVSPDTLAEHVVSRSAPGAGRVTPMVVPPAAVGAGDPTGAAPPSYPFWRPARIASITRHLLRM